MLDSSIHTQVASAAVHHATGERLQQAVEGVEVPLPSAIATAALAGAHCHTFGDGATELPGAEAGTCERARAIGSDHTGACARGARGWGCGGRSAGQAQGWRLSRRLRSAGVMEGWSEVWKLGCGGPLL